MVVPIQNLNPDVLMMEPAEDWYRCYSADLLPPPELWSILIQRQMCPELVVVRRVSLQDTKPVRFAEHDEVVERFAPDRFDEPLNVAVIQSCRMQMMRLMRLEFGFGLLIRFIRFETSHSVS